MQARFESIGIIWVFVKSKYFIKKTNKIFSNTLWLPESIILKPKSWLLNSHFFHGQIAFFKIAISFLWHRESPLGHIKLAKNFD